MLSQCCTNLSPFGTFSISILCVPLVHNTLYRAIFPQSIMNPLLECIACCEGKKDRLSKWLPWGHAMPWLSGEFYTLHVLFSCWCAQLVQCQKTGSHGERPATNALHTPPAFSSILFNTWWYDRLVHAAEVRRLRCSGTGMHLYWAATENLNDVAKHVMTQLILHRKLLKWKGIVNPKLKFPPITTHHNVNWGFGDIF